MSVRLASHSLQSFSTAGSLRCCSVPCYQLHKSQQKSAAEPSQNKPQTVMLQTTTAAHHITNFAATKCNATHNETIVLQNTKLQCYKTLHDKEIKQKATSNSDKHHLRASHSTLSISTAASSRCCTLITYSTTGYPTEFCVNARWSDPVAPSHCCVFLTYSTTGYPT